MKSNLLLFFAAMLATFLVPAAESAPLSNNGGGTVSDYRTGLTWQQAEGGAMDWQSALTYCNELSLAEMTDWRLPNVKELESITDDTRWNPPVDTSYFPNASSNPYWSSTTYLDSAFEFQNNAWYVGGGPWYGNKTAAFNVRCVRTTPCSYSISPESQSFGPSGGTGSVSVTAPFQGCSWQTANSPDWVSITAGGTGSGAVQFTVSANSGAERSCNISIAGTTFVITQAGSPSTNNAPSAPTLVFPSNGQAGLGTSVTFRWKKAKDPDGDTVSYHLTYCTDQTFTKCGPVDVASANRKTIQYAGMGWSGFLLIGAILAGGFMNRKKRALLLVALMLTCGLLISCGRSKGGGTAVSDDISYTASGLSASATYYWKVVADDGKGGTTESEAWSFSTQQ